MRTSELLGLLFIVAVIGTVYGAEVVLAIRVIRSIIKGRRSPFPCSKYFIILHILAIVGIGCFFYGFIIEPKWIDITKVELKTAKLKDIKLRIVLFSDTHCETKPRNEEKLVEIINSFDPDIVVFTGDSINTEAALPFFKKTLSLINARLGKFAVRGNFDCNRWGRLDLFSETGFRELTAETVKLEEEGETFCLAGFSTAFSGKFEAVLSKIPAESYNVLLYHYSDLAESLEDLNIDLYLSGHTHGGQVRLPFYGALITLSRFGKKYEAGIYTIGPTTLYVNRGIGLESKPAPQVRFLCRPEITVFDVIPLNKDKEQR